MEGIFEYSNAWSYLVISKFKNLIISKCPQTIYHVTNIKNEFLHKTKLLKGVTDMNQETITNSPVHVTTQENVRTLVITAACIALTYVFTAFVNIRLPIGGNGGLIHLGNVPLFLAAILFGRKTGAIAGGIGMGLFDLLSGWTLWAPFTFIVVGLMGYVVGLITEKHYGFVWNSIAIVCACVIKIAGYYVAEGIIYGNWVAPALSIPGNLIQVITAAILVIPIAGQLRKAVNYLSMK